MSDTDVTMNTQIMDAEEELEYCCVICLDIAEDGVETSCCHQLFCYDCLSRVRKKCPMCRRQFQIVTSSKADVIKRMLSKCTNEGCGKEVLRLELKEHKRVCLHRLFTCPSEGCEFQGKQTLFKDHLLQQHTDNIIRNATYCFMGGVGGKVESDEFQSRKTNDEGRNAHVGCTGKYYCKGLLDETDPTAKNCGPNLGDNCKSCMKLDIAARNLPVDWYVNKKGASCRMAGTDGLFYCGRKVKGTEPHCGPIEGPSCRYCQEMQVQYDKRYSGIW